MSPLEDASKLDLSNLNISIVCANLFWDASSSGHFASKGFWKFALADADMALVPRKLIRSVSVETVISHDFGTFAQKIADCHALELESLAEPECLERPNEVDDQVHECTPQFILRNIPKVERYYDLDRMLPFDLDDMPLSEATADIDEVRQSRLGEIEFIDVQSVRFVDDFRAFLEEIFYLCPWDQITRETPEADNPWHIEHSTSSLARDLLTRKNKLFIFSERGMTQMAMKSFAPRQEQATRSSDSGGGSPFGATFGPG